MRNLGKSAVGALVVGFVLFAVLAGTILSLGIGFAAGKSAALLAASFDAGSDGGTYAGIKAGTVPAELVPLYEKAAAGVDGCPAVTPVLLAAQGKQESGWNAKARSGANAQGIAQFLPATWAAYGVDGDGDGIKDVWNPADAIPAQAAYDCTIAKQVASIEGDPESLMLAAYNAGPYAVIRYGGIPPFTETQNYVKAIKRISAEIAAPQEAGGVDSSLDSSVPAGYPRLANGLGPNAERARQIIEKTFGVKIAVGSCVHLTDSVSDSYHLTGHACDVMTYSNTALAFKISRWAQANASRLGVVQIISDQHIWTTQRSSEGWRAMPDRGSVSANHKDHVHLSFDRSRTAPSGSVTGSKIVLPSSGVYSASITSDYGRRFHPVLHYWKLHDGTDFGAGCGASIKAPAGGTVVSAKMTSGYGNQVRIYHGMISGHRVETSYSHMSSMAVRGGSVSAGQTLGSVGQTGYATGCHLHLMVYVDGKTVDPMNNPYVVRG